MSYSRDQRGSWSEKIHIGGDSGPFFKAIAGLDGLWLVSLVLVAIWAAVASSKRNRNTPPIARLNKFWVTISIAIVFYAFSFGADILVDRGAEVTASYVLAEVIFGTLAGLVDICMLVTSYYLLFRILRQPGSSHSTAKNGILWAHYAFCVFLLGPLYLTELGLRVKHLHDEIINLDDTSSFYKGISISDILGTAFFALYVCASLEIVAGAVMTFTVRRQGRGRSTIGILLLLLVAFPLLVRSLFNLGFDAVVIDLEALQYVNISALEIAQEVLDGLCWVMIFIGIIIISLQESIPSISSPFNMENLHEPIRGPLFATDSQPLPIRDHSDEESALDGAIYSDHGKSSQGRKIHWLSRRMRGGGGLGITAF